MKPVINSFKIAFAMYSKIPMGQSDWTKENMRYIMCFFPFVGLVIGALVFGWGYLGGQLLGLDSDMAGSSLYAAILVLLPLAVSGGIHLDGFLDTSDALSSWQPTEKRLEILKDSRSGAFAVIMGCSYFLLDYGVCHAIGRGKAFAVYCLVFMLSRSLSALAIVKFPMAKNTGLAATFSDGAQKRTVELSMYFYLLVTALAMIALHPLYGAAALVTAAAVFFCYYRMSVKNFGGITGDLAGWFVQVCEVAVPLVLVFLSKLMEYL